MTSEVTCKGELSFFFKFQNFLLNCNLDLRSYGQLLSMFYEVFNIMSCGSILNLLNWSNSKDENVHRFAILERGYQRILWKAGNYEEKLSQEIRRRNYHRKLWGEFIKGNYEEKLSQEIIWRNYHRKLSAYSIYHHAKNVRIIGILAYPKIKSKRKRENRRVPLPFRGKRAENCLHNVEIIRGRVSSWNFKMTLCDL